MVTPRNYKLNFYDYSMDQMKIIFLKLLNFRYKQKLIWTVPFYIDCISDSSAKVSPTSNLKLNQLHLLV